MGKVLKGFAFLAVVGLVLSVTAQASTVLLVSDAFAPTDTTPDKKHNDDSLVAYLQSLGHTVDPIGMGESMREGNSPFDDPAKLAALQNADLIIISRVTSSGAYDNDRASWNGLETPLILMSGYLTRGEASSKKWGWSLGGSGGASKDVTAMDIEVGQEGHPFLAGLTGPVELFDWTTSAASEAPKAVYTINTPSEVVDDATVIGTFDGKAMLLDIPAGTDFDLKNGTVDKYGVAGARRAYLPSWGYDDNSTTGTNGPGETPAHFDNYLTDDFKAVLGATIATMTVVPEPGTVIMLVLGMVGLALYGVRRRK